MKEITLKIPESKISFFMELVRELGLEEVTTDDFLIPEEHKVLVRERIKNAKEDDFIPWDEARENLTFKSK